MSAADEDDRDFQEYLDTLPPGERRRYDARSRRMGRLNTWVEETAQRLAQLPDGPFELVLAVYKFGYRVRQVRQAVCDLLVIAIRHAHRSPKATGRVSGFAHKSSPSVDVAGSPTVEGAPGPGAEPGSGTTKGGAE